MPGDVGDDFNALREQRRELRKRFGLPCPRCCEKQPKRDPSILLPGQKCKVDDYRDNRSQEGLKIAMGRTTERDR